MSTIDTNYASLLSSLYSANTSGTSTVESLLSADTSSASSADSTSTQSTDTVSLSQQAQEAYLSLQQSLISETFAGDSADESAGDSIGSLLINSINARIKPYLDMIAAKENASATSSAAGSADGESNTAT